MRIPMLVEMVYFNLKIEYFLGQFSKTRLIIFDKCNQNTFNFPFNLFKPLL